MSIWKSGKRNFAKFLLQEIQKISSVNSEGKLQFKGGFSISAYDLLIECINSTEIFESKDVYLEKIVYDAVNELLLSGPAITESNFVNKFNAIKLNVKYHNTISYQLIVEAFVTTTKNQKIIFNNCEIRLLSKKFPRKTFPYEIKNELNNTVFLVTCNSPASEISRFKALEAINFVRALWYFCTPTSWKIESLESLVKPNNPIEISNICYYKQGDSNEIKKKQLVNFIKNPNSQALLKLDESTIKMSKKVLKILNIIKEVNGEYYNLLINSLMQFVKSLDSMDLTNSIPLLWGAIERLVKKQSESKYDEFITRCAFLYKNDLFVKNLL
ncbi:hypothetical protein [Legionella longbeachae]|uniref:hypothetical protein n=1 Tax=Legionella longbeachae TaxID=450 RepID=UPI00399D2DD0